MKKTDDERMRDLFHQMTDVPFPRDLEERILSQAKKMSKQQTRRKKLLQYLGKATTLAAGLMVASVLVVAIINRTVNVQVSNHETAKGVSSTQNERASEYKLTTAPLIVADLHVGQEQGYPTGSEVMATLTNDSNQVLNAKDVFGVLAFSKSQSLSSLGDANWVAFVNGPDKNHSIPPHQTEVWTFHPVGAPNHHFALSEVPHLVFYRSQLNSAAGDSVWSISQITVSNASVKESEIMHANRTDGKSVVVSADLQNTTHQPIDLKHTFALIWFDPNLNSSFATYGSMRFMNHISIDNQSQLNPGGKEHISFHVIGSVNTAYLQNELHIQIVNIP